MVHVLNDILLLAMQGYILARVDDNYLESQLDAIKTEASLVADGPEGPQVLIGRELAVGIEDRGQWEAAGSGILFPGL